MIYTVDYLIVHCRLDKMKRNVGLMSEKQKLRENKYTSVRFRFLFVVEQLCSCTREGTWITPPKCAHAHLLIFTKLH